MVQIGDKVKVEYRAFIEGGPEFDSSFRHGGAVELVVGNNRSVPGLEKSLLDMEPGEKKTVHLSADEAYGHYDENLIEKIPYDQMPNASELPIGKYIGVNMGDTPVFMKVLKIEDNMIYLDFNHELVDKDIVLEISLLSIETQSAIDREKHPAGCACGCDKLKEVLQ